MNLFDADLLNVLFGAVGAMLGYWLRGRSGRATPPNPTPTPTPTPAAPGSTIAPELTEALRLLLERQCQKQTQMLLNQLLHEPDKEKCP